MPKPHWISQFLTRAWEINSKGELAFFDFGAGRLGRPTPSARLFRESRRRRSAELEGRLNALLETPLARARERLVAPGQVFIDDWETYRAVVLTLFLQAPRTMAMQAGSDKDLAPLLVLPEDQINQVTLFIAQRKQFVRLGTVNQAHAIFYPDGGPWRLTAGALALTNARAPSNGGLSTTWSEGTHALCGIA